MKNSFTLALFLCTLWLILPVKDVALQLHAQDIDFIAKVVAYSPDGTMIAVGGSSASCDLDTPNPDRLRIFDAKTLDVLFPVPDTGCGVFSLSWSPDSTMLAIGDGSEGIRVWDISSEQYDPNIWFPGTSTTVQWSPDGSQIAFGDYSGFVTTINVSDGEISQRLDVSGEYVAWSPDGEQLVVTSGNRLVVFDMLTRTPIETMTYHIGIVTDLEWSGDGEIIVSYSPTTFDHTLRIIDVETSQNSQTISPLQFLNDIELRPDGRQVAGASPLGGLSIWDTTTGELLMSLEKEGIYGVAWSPDGSQLSYVGDFPDEIVSLDMPINENDE